MSAATCDRGATTPEPKPGATLRAACLFASAFVARSLQTRLGMLVARASAESKIHCRAGIEISLSQYQFERALKRV